MNQESNIPTKKPDVMDALLSEHARLGSGEDTALVEAILLRTVNQPLELPQPIAKASFGWQDWAKMAAAVTLFFGLTALVLHQIKGGERAETTFQLTVTYATVDNQMAEPDTMPEENPAPSNRIGIVRDVTRVVAATDLKPIAPIMQVAEFTLVETTSPAELNGTFTPSIDVFEAATAGRVESFAVSANHSKRTDSALEYDGKVEVNHPEFHIQADRLVVQASSSSTESYASTGAFQAFGAIIERTLENGQVETAKADELVYKPNDQSLELTGAKMELTAGSKTLHFDNENEKLILRPNGFQVVRK